MAVAAMLDQKSETEVSYSRCDKARGGTERTGCGVKAIVVDGAPKSQTTSIVIRGRFILVIVVVVVVVAWIEIELFV